MYKVTILSLLMVSGAIYSFDNETDPKKLYNELSGFSNDSERPDVLGFALSIAHKAKEVAVGGVETVKQMINGDVPKTIPAQEIISGISDAAEQASDVLPTEILEKTVEATEDVLITLSDILQEDSIAPIVPELNAGDLIGKEDSLIETIAGATNQKLASDVLSGASELLNSAKPEEVATTLEKVANIADEAGASKAGIVLKEVASTIKKATPEDAKKIVKNVSGAAKKTSENLLNQAKQQDPVRFASIRNFFDACWNAKPVDFACKMFNPKAHASAWAAMWKAGFKGALPTLWNDHKPVIAGTAVITAATVAAVYYANKKGMLEKAKSWVAAKQQQCQAYFA